MKSNASSNFDFEYIIIPDRYIILYPISEAAKKAAEGFPHIDSDGSIKMSIYTKDLWEQSGFILKEKEKT